MPKRYFPRELESALSRRNADYDRLHGDLTTQIKEKAEVALQLEKLKLELAAVRDDLASAKSSGSDNSELLRRKVEELNRSETARTTAEALCTELRNNTAAAKVGYWLSMCLEFSGAVSCTCLCVRMWFCMCARMCVSVEVFVFCLSAVVGYGAAIGGVGK